MNTVQPFEKTLQEIVAHLITDYEPASIILFGSFARGDAHRDSDIDLLIVKETDESPLERRVHVRRLVSQPERCIPFSPPSANADRIRATLGPWGSFLS